MPVALSSFMLCCKPQMTQVFLRPRGPGTSSVSGKLLGNADPETCPRPPEFNLQDSRSPGDVAKSDEGFSSQRTPATWKDHPDGFHRPGRISPPHAETSLSSIDQWQRGNRGLEEGTCTAQTLKVSVLVDPGYINLSATRGCLSCTLET